MPSHIISLEFSFTRTLETILPTGKISGLVDLGSMSSVNRDGRHLTVQVTVKGLPIIDLARFGLQQTHRVGNI